MNLYATPVSNIGNHEGYLDSNYFGEEFTSKIIILPFWIANAVIRNKLDYIDVLDYNKVRNIMSLEDLWQILVINNFHGSLLLRDLGGNNLAIYENWLDSITNDQLRSEAINTTPYSENYCFKEIIVRLKTLEDGKRVVSENEVIDYSKYYSLTIGKDKNIYFILYEGFLNHLENPLFKKQLLTDILKKLYSLNSIKFVSAYYKAFEHYVNLLY